MTSFSLVKLFTTNYSNTINVIINDKDFNDNSILSKLLLFDDKIFKNNKLEYENGLAIRSLLNYNININQWTSYIKAIKIGIEELNTCELKDLEKFLAITGGSQKLWDQLHIINKNKRMKIFYDNLEYNINPKCETNDKFKIYKKWKYYHRGAIQIKDDNWIKGNYNKEIGFECALKYTKNELDDNIDRIKNQIINKFKLNNIHLPHSLFIKQYNYSIIFEKTSSSSLS